jgi:myo-inositol 2-dehydrogenase / D-chiro-inositol 1-dehydrogenase
MEQVRIGVIGAGRIAHIMSNAYREVTEAKLVAVADIVRAASERLAARSEIPVIHENYLDLLASDGVDAVLVCVPTHLHEEVVLAAAQAGKHIFCQKPMALTVEQCVRMTEAAKAKDLILQVGFMLRFTPPFVEVKESIESGEIGDLIAIRSAVFGWLPNDEWFYDPQRGGGVLIDTIIHSFDLFHWYAGDVDTIFACGGAYVLDGAKKYNTPDNVMCSFRFKNKAIGSLYGTWTSGYGDKTLEVYGTNGSIFIDLMTKQGGKIFIKSRLSEQSRPNGWSNLGVLWRYGYQGEAKQFVSCILGRSPPRATGRDAIEAQKLAILADRSIRTGELVRVS